MKKVFISQHMNGLTDEDILANREYAITEIKKRVGDDVQILESFFLLFPSLLELHIFF